MNNSGLAMQKKMRRWTREVC